MEPYNSPDNVDYAYFQTTINSRDNILRLSVVFLLLALQKLLCLGIYYILIFFTTDLWAFQRDKWYYFAVILGVASYVSGYLNRHLEMFLPISVITLIILIFSTGEAYLAHFCLCFLPEAVRIHYWIYQFGLFAYFSTYFNFYCRRIEFKTLSKLQLLFLIILTIISIAINVDCLYFLLAYGFIFNIIGYVYSYKAIQFLFITSDGWAHRNHLRSTLDLYIDNQVLFPLALIDTANFVVDAISYE